MGTTFDIVAVASKEHTLTTIAHPVRSMEYFAPCFYSTTSAIHQAIELSAVVSARKQTTTKQSSDSTDAAPASLL
jgi:hypothetical protein